MCCHRPAARLAFRYPATDGLPIELVPCGSAQENAGSIHLLENADVLSKQLLQKQQISLRWLGRVAEALPRSVDLVPAETCA
jgi:hypothetical protein